MTEISAEHLVPTTTEEGAYSLDDGLEAVDADGDDFDFDLGGVDEDGGHLDGVEEAVEGKVAEGNPAPEVAGDADEIGYEDEDEGAGVGNTGEGEGEGAHDALSHDAADHGAVDKDDDDEIGYEEVDLAAYGSGPHDDAVGHQEAEGTHNDGGYEFEDAEDNAGAGDEGEVDQGQGGEASEIDQDNSDRTGPDYGSHDVDAGEEEDEAEEAEAADQEEAGEADEADEAEETEDVEGDSHADFLDTGLDRLQSLYPVSTFDVTVTWGEQVCPLFKTPGNDDPDSFYLEDYAAMDYPLSKFLQTIRSSIASWVHSTDEIYVRVEGLGLEFGETTTEALLSQVTFHNLLALHNTLVKNDSPDAHKGVHVTLGTRPNCLLRLRDLVGGASAGKGLSAVLASTDDSSDDSGEAEAEADQSSPDDEAEAEADQSSPDDEAEGMAEEEEEDEGGALVSEADGADVDMAGSFDEDSADAGSVPQAAGQDTAEPDTSTVDEDDDGVAGSAAEEADFAEFTNENENTEDSEDAEDAEDAEGAEEGGEMADGVSLTGASGPTTADHEEMPGEVGNDNDLLATDTVENVGDHGELDLLEDLDHGEAAPGSVEEAGQDGVHLEPENGLESAEHGDQQGGNDDDFLDLHGDIDDAAAAVPEPGNTASADDLRVALDTSAKSDEIDYEDSRPAQAVPGPSMGVPPDVSYEPMNGSDAQPTEAALDADIDEIDWDEEIKNAAPSATASTPAAAPGKRTREADEPGDGLVLEDLPDLKRHRTSHSPV